MQCGITCVKMICRYYGRRISNEYLEALCPSTTQGVSISALNKTLQELGFRTICGKFDIDTLQTLPLPCILHWTQDHYVVLYKTSQRKGRRYFFVSDPAKGRIRYTEDEMALYWLSTISQGKNKGIALLACVTPAFDKVIVNEKEEKKSLSRTILFLIKYFAQYWKYLLQVLTGMAIGCGLQFLFPILTQAVVDIGINQKNIKFIYLVLAGQLMLALGNSVFTFTQRWIMLHITMRVNLSMINSFLEKLMELPMSYFDIKSTGDILQRIGDHSRVREFLTGTLLSLPFSIVSLVILSVVLCRYNLQIFITFAALSMVYALWLCLFLGKRKMIDNSFFEKNAEVKNKTLGIVQSMQEIKLQGCKQRRICEWGDLQAGLFSIQAKELQLSQQEYAGDFLINNFKTIVITCLSANAVVNGDITLGMMLAIQAIVGQLEGPVAMFVSLIYAIQDINISLERINEVKAKPKEQDLQCDNIKNIGKGDVVLDDVSFRYDANSPFYALSDICLTIPCGKVTAIVGCTGCGKTTLLKLLLGYYSDFSGNISVGNYSLKSLDLEYWRNRCGIVMQDGCLFSESIARNIAVGTEEIDVGRMRNAAHVACIDSYINSLPLKYDTVIGRDGRGLSVGQKQRILIARAVYKNPEYLFLDEATNSLDATTEKQIAGNLASFYKGRTVFVIAHRLSTIVAADNIVVMEKGRIVEQGRHQSLLLSHGVYYHLVKDQLYI